MVLAATTEQQLINQSTNRSTSFFSMGGINKLMGVEELICSPWLGSIEKASISLCTDTPPLS